MGSGHIVKLGEGECYGERASTSNWRSGGGTLSGVQGRAPGQGVKGAYPLKLRTVLLLDTRQMCRACWILNISWH